MNFFSFCRRGALTGMLLLLEITSAQAADWPRQVTDSYGTHTLPSQPLRIVSTSVTLTGSLLAIDAPVVASGATTPNNRVADSQGFLRQWSEVAKARKLARLYIGEPSAEAVAAQMPDLILVSRDRRRLRPAAVRSALKPSPRRWSSTMTIKAGKTLLTQLGQITGHEQQASARIADFNKQLVSLKEKNETAAAAGDRPGLYRRRAQRQYLDAGIGSGADARTAGL
ncbi:Ferric enterobactin-binding periplasmic protein FepB [Klebsiella pneumoniae]|nr:Ferric enterobactin-binding periplasmic protein FepB [Klebsiella pneumoniae]